MKLYALDVGIYVRAPLLPQLAQLIGDGQCIVTHAALQVFRHGLQDSVQYFLKNHRDIKQALRASLSRHNRKQSVHKVLRLLESKRQGMEDSLLYTALRAALTTPSPRQNAGYLLEKLLMLLENTRHAMELLDTLYSWLHAASSKGSVHSFVASIEHLLSHYLENNLKCIIDKGSDYATLARDAARLAERLKLRDKEDIVILLSLYGIENAVGYAGNAVIVLVTTDHKVKDTLEKLRSYDKCLTKVSVHLIRNLGL